MDDRIPFTEEQPVLYVNNAPFHLWMLDGAGDDSREMEQDLAADFNPTSPRTTTASPLPGGDLPADQQLAPHPDGDL